MSTFDAHTLKAGIWGGLAGGAVFGIMMAMMGLLPMVAMLVGSESSTVGFIVHMVISAIIGILFTIFLGAQVKSVGSGIGWGLVYGVIWWVLGPLLIMPVWLGMGVQLSAAGVQVAIPSLFGHLVYGLVLGLVFFLLAQPPKTADVQPTDSPAV